MRAASAIMIIALAIRTTNIAPAQQWQAEQRGGVSVADRFKQLDRNGDGKVTREEATELPMFDQWDANKDGAVTLEEVTDFYAKRRAKGGATNTPSATPKTGTKPAPAVSARVSRQELVPDALFVGEVNGSYIDPEFSEGANQVVFQDIQNKLWIGDIDPETGLFKTATGRDYLMDENITIIFDRPPQGRKFSTNGPEWTRDEKGHCVVYTKADKAGIMQQWMARLVNGKSVVTQLTHNKLDSYGNMPSRFQDGKPPRVAYTYDWPIWKAKAAWIFVNQPDQPHELANFDYKQMSMWSAVSPHFLFVQTPPGSPHGQVAVSDADTGAVRVLTDDAGAKDDPGMFKAPEFGGEVLLVCNVDNSALAIYRDEKHDGKSPWTRIATLTLPADAPHKFISSPETIGSNNGIGGVSYFSLLARENKDRRTPGSIWVLGLGNDEKNRFVRRVDDGAVTGEQASLLEPEPFVGKNEVYVYYNYFGRGSGKHGLRRASTEIKIAATAPSATPGTLFRRVEIPGFTDIVEGNNGIALADLNRDGKMDVVATYTEPKRGLSASGHHLRVFVNQGELRFQPHAIRIRDSRLTAAEFGRNPEIPNLVDFNGDGLLDIFITRSSPMMAGKKLFGIEAIGNTLLLSDGAWDQFRDVSAKLGARNETGYNRQSSIADVNKDGWLDIAIGCDNIGNAMGGVPHSRLYVFKPNGPKFEDGHFEDIGGTDLVPDFGGFYHDSAKDKAGPGITLRDLDNDGDLDLVQSFHCDVRQPLLPYSPGEYRQGVFCWKNLLAETGQLRFEKISGNGLACEARLKYNRDKQLYESVGKAPGLPYLFFADVDNDGLQDVLAIGPSDPGWAPRAENVGGRFWHNLGHFQFKEATSAVGLDALNWTYRQWYRFFDVAIPPQAENWKPRSATYLGQPGRKQTHPLDERFYFSNAIFGDFDNDGWLDLVVLDRHESPTRPVYRAALFMNLGDGTFELKPTTFSGLDSTGISGEAADLNNDGLLDIVIACDPDNSGGGRAGVGPERYNDKVYLNTGTHGAKQNHWLRLRFSGIKDAELIGARVEAHEPASGKLLGTRWIHSNHSYKSGGALEAHFGLGKATTAEVKVTLLNGTTATFPGVRADQFLALDLKTSQSTPAGKESTP